MPRLIRNTHSNVHGQVPGPTQSESNNNTPTTRTPAPVVRKTVAAPTLNKSTTTGSTVAPPAAPLLLPHNTHEEEDYSSTLSSGVVEELELEELDEALEAMTAEFEPSKPQRAKLPKVPPVKKPKRWRLTASDLACLRFLDRVGYATAAHLAVAAGMTPNGHRRRMKLFLNHGYIREDNRYGVLPVYTLSSDGLSVIGSTTSKPRSPKAASTISHTLKTSTVLALAMRSNTENGELEDRYHNDRLTAWACDQRKKERRYQRNLEKIEGWHLECVPMDQWTPAQRQVVRNSQKGLILAPEPSFLNFRFALPDDLQTVVPISVHEDAIEKGAAAVGDRDAQFMAFQNLDAQHELAELKASFETKASEDRQSDFDGKEEWKYQSYRINEHGMLRTHRPDAVLAYPPSLGQDGRLHARSVWIEIEENAKPKVDTTVETMAAAITHPLVGAVWFYTLSSDVNNELRKAQNLLIERISSNREGFGGIPYMPEEQAKQLVDHFVKRRKSLYFNERVKPGFFG